MRFIMPDGSANTDDFLEANWDKILEMRDGCRCQEPNAMPPCDNCTRPVSCDEISELLDMWVGKVPKTTILELQQKFIDQGFEDVTLS